VSGGDILGDLAWDVQNHAPDQPWGRHGTQPVPVEITYDRDQDYAGRKPWAVRFVTDVKNGRRVWGHATGATLTAALDAARDVQRTARPTLLDTLGGE
jgi:hypothetical protein